MDINFRMDVLPSRSDGDTLLSVNIYSDQPAPNTLKGNITVAENVAGKAITLEDGLTHNITARGVYQTSGIETVATSVMPITTPSGVALLMDFTAESDGAYTLSPIVAGAPTIASSLLSLPLGAGVQLPNLPSGQEISTMANGFRIVNRTFNPGVHGPNGYIFGGFADGLVEDGLYLLMSSANALDFNLKVDNVNNSAVSANSVLSDNVTVELEVTVTPNGGNLDIEILVNSTSVATGQVIGKTMSDVIIDGSEIFIGGRNINGALDGPMNLSMGQFEISAL